MELVLIQHQQVLFAWRKHTFPHLMKQLRYGDEPSIGHAAALPSVYIASDQKGKVTACSKLSANVKAPTEQVGMAQLPPTPRQPSSKVRPPPTASAPRSDRCGGMSLTTCKVPALQLHRGSSCQTVSCLYLRTARRCTDTRP